MSKKIKLSILGIIAISLTTIVSCSKEEKDEKTTIAFDESLISKRLQFVDIKTSILNSKQSKTKWDGHTIVSWNEWGRKSKDCKGWGLCDAHWFPDNPVAPALSSPNGSASLLMIDENSEPYIDILLAETAPSDIPVDALTLKIDEDFQASTPKTAKLKLTFHKGKYLFDSSLGQHGGYRIYLN